MSIKNFSEITPQNRKVILRCDLNVPVKNGVIGDDGRIVASLSTIKELLDNNCSIVVIAHLGRPKGQINPDLSLQPIAKRLGELLNREVKFSTEILGIKNVAQSLAPGEILMLENIRFLENETSKDEALRNKLATELSEYGDFYVGDGFGAVHRKHASVYELARLLPHCAGNLISNEVKVLEKLSSNPDRPYGVVLGGAKVSDKIGVISNLLDKVDVLIVGGGMVFTFLAANGMQIGKSLVETDLVPTVKDLLLRANSLGVKILLPSDIVVAKEFAENSQPSVVSSDQIPMDQMGLDIGPVSASAFADEIKKCKTVFWNGPMGMFEDPRFASGTKTVAQAVADTKAFTVVGGGDSAAALAQFKLDDEVDHVSTGGGASLEFLELGDLPGLAALRGAPNAR